MKHKIDLDEARQIEQAMSPLPWIVLEEENGEMIIIRNSNHPMYIDGIVAWGRVAEANTPDAIGIAYMRENFSNLIGEIERLRDRVDAVRLEERYRWIHNYNQQAARIKELEDALVEELARGDYFDESQECEGYWWDRKNTSDCTQNDYRRNARLKLQAKGKIGPDAKPREGLYGKYHIAKADGSPVDPEADYFVLRLDTDPVARRAAREYSYMTVDRKLALDLQERITKYNPKMMDCINLQFFGVEKPRVWQITEERKAAIKTLLVEMNDVPTSIHDIDLVIHAENVLRAMLKEAE